MLGKSSRKFLKQALWWARVKLIYSRITLTKFTTLYFFSALLTCTALCIFQGVIYFDNKAAGDLVQGLRSKSRIISTGVVVEVSGHLEHCSNIPGERGANCTVVGHDLELHEDSEDFEESDDDRRRAIFDLVSRDPGRRAELVSESGTNLNEDCLFSLHWFSDRIRDAKGEDVLTLTFVIWLFTISVVAILNESIPHLVAGLAAHVLATSWATFRAATMKSQQSMYKHLIADGACGVDLLGNSWWTTRQNHTYVIIALNIVALVSSLALTIRLYKVYSAHSFRLAGGSPILHAAYKRVLLLSVLLQLSGFFLLGSTALWIDKVSFGNTRSLTTHFDIYLGVFITVAVVEVPWLVLGWISVRRESRQLFFLFSVSSLLLLVAPTFLFSRPMFRFVFNTWSFFAVIAVTAYILMVLTPIAAVLCRLNFGKGLPEYLGSTEKPEGHDFTPVYFTQAKRGSKASFESDLEKDPELHKLALPGLSYSQTPLQVPPSAYTPRPKQETSQRKIVTSVYSDLTRETVKLSTTPPVAQGPSALSSVEVASMMHKSPTRSPATRGPAKGLPSNPRFQLSTGSPRLTLKEGYL